MKPHILIVDDDKILLEIAKAHLLNAGYSVTIAADGYDALEKLGAQRYDLMISDINMQGISGFDLE